MLIPFSISGKVLAIVNSETGSANFPLRIQSPEHPGIVSGGQVDSLS